MLTKIGKNTQNILLIILKPEKQLNKIEFLYTLI